MLNCNVTCNKSVIFYFRKDKPKNDQELKLKRHTENTENQEERETLNARDQSSKKYH